MTRTLVALACVAAAAAAFAPAARADRLVLSDGRVVEGVVTQDGETYRVVSRFGESVLAAKDVKEWVKGKTVDAEWRERAAALKPDDWGGRAALAQWLKEAGRPEAAEATAIEVLDADPENAVAHAVLGHVRHKGKWMTPDEAKTADGLVRRGDQWYTPEEWALLDAAAKEKAEAAEKQAVAARIGTRLNDAVRLVLSPDPKVREAGLKRMKALAEETKSKAIEDLIPQVQAYAEAGDRMARVLADPGAVASTDKATVVAECRITLAKLKRPIKTFETSLSSNLSTAPVRIQLPELEIIRIGTTVPIPAAVDR